MIFSSSIMPRNGNEVISKTFVYLLYHYFLCEWSIAGLCFFHGWSFLYSVGNITIRTCTSRLEFNPWFCEPSNSQVSHVAKLVRCYYLFFWFSRVHILLTWESSVENSLSYGIYNYSDRPAFLRVRSAPPHFLTTMNTLILDKASQSLPGISVCKAEGEGHGGKTRIELDSNQCKTNLSSVRTWIYLALISIACVLASLSVPSGVPLWPNGLSHYIDLPARYLPVDNGRASSEVSARTLFESNGRTDQVQWDNYSLILRGQRVFLQ